jgi:hypothetical protein
MSQNNTGITWTGEEAAYFLRDDEAMGICDYERYSLFRLCPDYGRVVVLAGSLSSAIAEAHNYVADDCDDPVVFEDERGLPEDDEIAF